MPGSVIVVSDDPNLFESVRATLRSDSRFIDACDGVHCDGSVVPLTNIYPVEMTPAEWDGWESGDSQMPDPWSMSALILECRSPTWVAEVGMLLAQGLERPVCSLTQRVRLGPLTESTLTPSPSPDRTHMAAIRSALPMSERPEAYDSRR